MKSKYFPIDKRVIQESVAYDFSIYIPTGLQKEMDCFKEKGSFVTRGEQIMVNTTKVLYVNDLEYPIYKRYLNTFSKHSKEHKNISFDDKISAMYKNASIVLNNLFDNPEVIANYKASKNIVKDMVEIVLDDEFSIKSLMEIVAHDYHTQTHSINVSIYATSLGSYLGIKGTALSDLGEASLLHDLGKSKIDKEITDKNGALSDGEYEEMKKHPGLGYSLGLKLGIKNRNILEGIRHHHERMDGSGYPLKLKGEEIPYFARIIGICEIFDALTSKRTYKEAMTSFDALMLMKTTMKEHIDVKLLRSMIEMFR